MSLIRLMVLGVVRQAQPVHGYEIQRTLASWHLDSSAAIKTGSVYSALKSMCRDGLLILTDAAQQDRPERTQYLISAEGEKEFFVLLRRCCWQVSAPVLPFTAVLPFFPDLSRQEMISAMEARTQWLRQALKQNAIVADMVVPEHIAEVLSLTTAQLRAELEWTKGFRQRLQEGAYVLAGDDHS